MVRPFRFGVVANSAHSQNAWYECARKAEELGYSTLLVSDSISRFVQLAPLTALAVAASVTTTLRVGSFVFANDYRHPALLAKEIATLDLLTGGRVELGIGPGGSSADYAALGLSFATPGTRISRFAEALHIIKGFFTEDELNFTGQHYTVTALKGIPKPLQKPHPPIYIGAAGKRMLTLAAREADIIGIGPKRTEQDLDPEDVPLEQKITWVQEAAGERFAQLELSQMAFSIFLTDSDSPTKLLVGGSFPIRYITTEQAVTELLEQRERFGFSYIQVSTTQMENFAPVVARLAGK